MSYKISVIVPVFNGERYVKECCEQLEKQTIGKEIQVIFINDGSSDNSLSVMQECSKQYSNVVVVNQKNQGVSCARNKGLESANGEYIGFMDVDDQIDIDMYETLYQFAQNNFLDISAMENIGEKGADQIITEKDKWMYYFLNDKISMAVWNKIYKRSLLGNNAFPVGKRIHEDLYVVYNALKNANKIGIINIKKYHYVQREGSSSRPSEFSEKFFDAIEIADYLYNDALKRFPNLALWIEARKAKTYLRISKIYYLRKAPKQYRLKIDEMKKYLKNLDKRKLRDYFIKTDIIRYYLYIYAKPLFLLLIKTIDKR